MTFLESLFLDAYKEFSLIHDSPPTAEECREKMPKMSEKNEPVSYSLIYGYAKKHSLKFATHERGERSDITNKLMEFYKQYTKEHGIPPTGVVIGKAINISPAYACQILKDVGLNKKKCSIQLIDSEYKAYVSEHGGNPSVQALAKQIGLPVQTVNGFLLKHDLKKRYNFKKDIRKDESEMQRKKDLIQEKYTEFLKSHKRPPSEAELSTECGYTQSKVTYAVRKLGLECSDGHKFRRELLHSRVHRDVNSQFWDKAILVFARQPHPSPYGALKTKTGYVVKQVGSYSLRLNENQFNENFMTLKERMENYEHLRKRRVCENTPQQG